MSTERYKAARLLSGREGLSVREKEEILSRVLQESSDQIDTGASGWLAIRRLVVATAALAILIAIPLGILRWQDDGEDQLRSRGVAGSPYGFALACTHARGGDAGCLPGDKLMFRVKVPEGKPYFAAFARGGDNTVIWYFPGRDADRSIEVRRNLVEGVLSLGILLGPEHRPGRYEVFGLFSSQPLDKARIRAVVENTESEPEYIVLTRQEFSVGSP